MNYLLDAIWTWKAARNKIREEWGLGALTDEQLAESLELMLQGQSYKKESARLKKEYGVVMQPSSLHSFYKDRHLSCRRGAARRWRERPRSARRCERARGISSRRSSI
jgi:hypothetical protein